MAVLGYSTANSQNGSNSFCFAVEGNVDSVATGSKVVSGAIKVYAKGNYVPYYSWSHTVKLTINGTSVVNKSGNYPGASGDWVSTSTTIGGTTYQKVYTAGTGSASVGNGGIITVSGSYSVSGSATYLPVAGTYIPSGTIYVTPSYWNDISVMNPSGTQDYLSGYFDLYTSENNSWRYNLLNEDSDMTHLSGSYFQVQNIRPYWNYYTLNYVDGYDSIPSTGAYRKTFDGASERLTIYMKYTTFYIIYDANGGSGAPGQQSYTYAPSGTTNLSSTIPIRSGYDFLGWSLSSTATTASYAAGQAWNLNNASNYTLYAVWRVSIPSNLSLSRTDGSTTSISVTMALTGLNITSYILYYKKASDTTYLSINNGTASTYIFSSLDTDTNYNIYFTATNAGGTATSSTYTYSTLLGYPSITTPSVTNLLPFSCTITATGSITPSKTLTYRFSSDGGSTWTSYQSSNSYNWIGLSEETSYNMAVMVLAAHVGDNASDTSTMSSILEVITPADQASIRLKILSLWKKGKLYIKKLSIWKKVKKVYIKKNGTWYINKND